MTQKLEDLLNILGGFQSARLTAEKTETIMDRDGYQISGFVLCSPDGKRAIVEMSAVRWLNKDTMFKLMQG